MSGAFLVARILFSLIFLASGVGHVAQVDAMSQYAGSRGVPATKPVVVLSGLLIVLGGLSVLLGAWGDLGALAIVVFLVPTTLVMHRFWDEDDPQAAQTEQVMFMKNLAMIGGALAIYVVFATLGDVLGYVLTDPATHLTP